MKSASAISSVQSAAALPGVTLPFPFLRSMLYALAGDVRSNWKTVPTCDARFGFCSMYFPIAVKMSPVVGSLETGPAVAAACVGAAFVGSSSLGISL